MNTILYLKTAFKDCIVEQHDAIQVCLDLPFGLHSMKLF